MTKSHVRSSIGQLNTTMGLPPQTPLKISMREEKIVPPEFYNLDQALAESVHQRPEIHGHDQLIQSICHKIDNAKSQHWPTIAANGVYGWRDEKLSENSHEWLFGVSLQLPLFTGFEISQNVCKLKHELCRQRAKRDQLELTVQQEVWTSHTNLHEAYEMIETATVQVRDAEESRRLAEERYDAGSGTITDLLDAQTALAHAEATLVEAHWHYHTAVVVFMRSQGKLV